MVTVGADCEWKRRGCNSNQPAARVSVTTSEFAASIATKFAALKANQQQRDDRAVGRNNQSTGSLNWPEATAMVTGVGVDCKWKCCGCNSNQPVANALIASEFTVSIENKFAALKANQQQRDRAVSRNNQITGLFNWSGATEMVTVGADCKWKRRGCDSNRAGKGVDYERICCVDCDRICRFESQSAATHTVPLGVAIRALLYSIGQGLRLW